MQYASVIEKQSESVAGVTYRVRRMSFGRRLALARELRALGQRMEFAAAGEGVRDKIEAAMAAGEIDRIYLEWGLETVMGLELDGEAATPAGVLEKGPEELTREILEAIKAECGLTEAERKN